MRHEGPEILQRRPRLLVHEERHSTQYAYCLGVAMVLLYVLASAWSLLRTGDPASRNIFERLAGLADGGYTEHRYGRSSAGSAPAPSRRGHAPRRAHRFMPEAAAPGRQLRLRCRPQRIVSPDRPLPTAPAPDAVLP